MDGGAWWAAVHGVVKSPTGLSDFPFTFNFHALEKETATHSSVLAWRIPGTEEPFGPPSLGSHRVRHDWSDLAAVALVIILGFHCGSLVKNLPAMQEPQEMRVWSLGWEDPLEEGMGTCCSILAWRIPWTEEPGVYRLQGRRVGHNWSDWAHMHNDHTIMSDVFSQQDHRAESASPPPGPSFLTLELIPGVHYQKICSLVWQFFPFPTLAWNQSLLSYSCLRVSHCLLSHSLEPACEPESQPYRAKAASQSPEIHPSWGEAWSFRFS